MTSGIFIDSTHLFLFAQLMNLGRVSIRCTNSQIVRWRDLEKLGFCSVRDGVRAGTFVIHNSKKAYELAESFISMMGPDDKIYKIDPRGPDSSGEYYLLGSDIKNLLCE